MRQNVDYNRTDWIRKILPRVASQLWFFEIYCCLNREFLRLNLQVNSNFRKYEFRYKEGIFFRSLLENQKLVLSLRQGLNVSKKSCKVSNEILFDIDSDIFDKQLDLKIFSFLYSHI